MEYYAAIKGTNYYYKQWSKKSYTVWFHLQNILKNNKIRKMESKLFIARD